MAIAIGNTSGKEHENTITPSSLGHTINSGSNRILAVAVSERNVGSSQGVTFNGVAMTKLVEQVSQLSADWKLTWWYMLESQLPAGGAYNIAYTNGGDSRAFGQMFAHCFSNVQQTAPFVYDSDNTTNSNYSRSITLNNLRNGDGILFASTINRNTDTWVAATDYTTWFSGANDGAPSDLPSSSTGIRRIVTASGNYTANSTRTSGSGFVTSAALAFHPAFRPKIIMTM